MALTVTARLEEAAHTVMPQPRKGARTTYLPIPSYLLSMAHYRQGSETPEDSILPINAGRNKGNRGGEGGG